ncbi:MAG: gamma-glutamyltransferase [Desulfovibrio sp.]|nr:gamma-glutamyltransferase [Desulfovibrio sp.]
MVTSPHHLASEAGLDILRHGGSVVDAAIAAAAVLTVVYPQMCTLGGDGFWLIHNAATGETVGINASGRSGEKATCAFYEDLGLKAIPSRGPLAANTVPGIVSGWEAAWGYSRRRMGSQSSWAGLLACAADLARDGAPVSTSLAFWERRDVEDPANALGGLQRFSGFSETFLNDGKTFSEGEVLRQPDLARTFDRLAAGGAEEFYRGETAERIVSGLAAGGGLLTLNDFAAHRADFVTPLTTGYRGFTACNLPPNTQGVASLAILRILENFDVRDLWGSAAMSDPPGADYFHVMVEATKLAFADRDRWVTDPDFSDIPLKELLSAGHARRQAERIDMRRAQSFAAPLDPHGDTVWLGTADAAGNAVSMIQSVYHDFGSGFVAKDTGVLLQNRGCFFSLDPRAVNCLAPRKRTLHTLNPAMLLKEGRPYLVYGTMGGEGQPQTQSALVTRIVDMGQGPGEAVDAPRWLYGRSWGNAENDLKLEGRIPRAVAEELARRGHRVTMVGEYDSLMGHAGAILYRRNGVLQGASDPRSDGAACGF